MRNPEVKIKTLLLINITTAIIIASTIFNMSQLSTCLCYFASAFAFAMFMHEATANGTASQLQDSPIYTCIVH